jgi:hypothetical protein
MMAEVDHDVAGRNGRGKIIADIDLAADLESRIIVRRSHQGLPHPATRSIDQKPKFFHSVNRNEG